MMRECIVLNTELGQVPPLAFSYVACRQRPIPTVLSGLRPADGLSSPRFPAAGAGIRPVAGAQFVGSRNQARGILSDAHRPGRRA